MPTRVSLGHAFAAGSLVGEDPVKPAFALALDGGFLTRLSRPLGTSDIFSEVYRPSRTTHLLVSPLGLVMQRWKGSVTLAPPSSLSRGLRRLLPTLYIQRRITAGDCSKAPRGLLFPSGVSGLITGTTVSPGTTSGQWGPR